MSDGDYLKCPCKECGNNVEFPPHMARDTIPCPHCGEWTELLVPGLPEPVEPGEGTNAFTVVLGIVLLLALAGGAFFFLHSKKPAPTDQTTMAAAAEAAVQPAVKPANVVVESNETAPEIVEDPAKSRPKSLDDLKPGEVALEKTKGSSLVYASGIITNDSAYQRFGVKVVLDIISRKGAKIGVTQDYKDVLEPHKQWHFHALIPESKAAAARITSLKED